MHKIWIVACREYRAIVGTKAFVMAIVLMPVLMFGGIAVQKFLEGRVGPSERRILVAGGAELYDDLVESRAGAERERNRRSDNRQTDQAAFRVGGRPVGNARRSAARYEISERIRRRELDAFIEIPAHATDLPPRVEPVKVVFHAENAAVAEERNWLQAALGDAIRVRRMRTAGLDPGLVARAGTGGRRAVWTGRAFADRRTQQAQAKQYAGDAVCALRRDDAHVGRHLSRRPADAGERFGGENAAHRGSFVGLGQHVSVDVGEAARRRGRVVDRRGDLHERRRWDWPGISTRCDMVPFRVLPWFFVYQVLAVMLFGSIFMAIGAAVTQLKEAQSMLLPIWLVLTFPLFIWLQVVREPLGPLATWGSFFPPATPLLMVLRIGASGAVPWWQSVLGVVVLLATTLACVLAAAQIFASGSCRKASRRA